jgi:acetylornithine deacetylase/succinyl-diaminopimelate desuccinylase-like protein
MSIPPFEPRVESGKMFGRGSCDTKAGLAAMMHAVASLREEGIQPPCEVWLAAVVDEEFSFRGVVKLCEGLTADAALVAEPTDLRAVIASKGVLRWRMVSRGKAAHSGKPHLGVNAINHMARVVLALEEDHRRLASQIHPLLGPATCNVGIIHGGAQVNFVPDACAIEIDRRLLPGETAATVLAHYQALLDALKEKHPTMDVFMEPPMLTDEALETPADSAPAQLASALLREMGLDPTLRGVPFGSDASKLSRQGIPSLVFGPGSIDQAHGAVEFVDLAQVERAFEFYRRFILRITCSFFQRSIPVVARMPLFVIVQSPIAMRAPARMLVASREQSPGMIWRYSAPTMAWKSATALDSSRKMRLHSISAVPVARAADGHLIGYGAFHSVGIFSEYTKSHSGNVAR